MTSPSPLPRVAVIGTGGTIASVGRHSLELVEYITNKKMYDVNELLARVPEAGRVADVVPVPYAALPSTSIEPSHWLELNARIHSLAEEDPALDGIVLTHGTATLEETAYFLGLTLKVDRTVVVTGAQRPASGLGTDAFLNIVNALRVAGSEAARGLGVLVMLNDEIHAAREVAKTSTQRLQTFRTPDFGGPRAGRCGWCQHLPPPGPPTGARHRVRRAGGGRGGAAAGRREPLVRGGGRRRHRRLRCGRSEGNRHRGVRPGTQHEGPGSGPRARPRGGRRTRPVEPGGERPGARPRRRPAAPRPHRRGQPHPWKARILLMLALRETGDRNELRRMFETY